MSDIPTNERAKPLEFDELKLLPGAVMQVQAFGESSHARHEVKFIGHIKDRSVIVTLPFQEGLGLWLAPGKAFVLRGFNGTHAYAFSAQVIRAHTNPFPYVHFSWPHEMECQLVRKSLRVNVSLPAQVALSDNSTVAVTLLDLSTLGSMLDSATPLGNVNDRAKIEFPVNLEGATTTLNLPITIRNIHTKPDGTGYNIGIGFEEIAQNELLILHYFTDSIAQGSMN